MKKKIIFKIILLAILMFFSYTIKSYGANLDEIVDYQIKVDPRMSDATLDITYTITWKVLDSTTEGPKKKKKIGTANDNYDSLEALSKNIKSISKLSGSYVKITFDRAYFKGESVTFKYSLHQKSICRESWGDYKFKFTPAWFTDARIDNMTILWNANAVKNSGTKVKEDNYYIWNKTNLSNGSKMTVNITYDKNAFSNADTSKSYSSDSFGIGGIGIYIVLIIVISIITSFLGGGDGYYRHGGFYGGGYHGGYYGGCASSCACAHSSCASSCACACAGSGRAGCSRKDFYGTNITREKLNKVFNNKNYLT